MLRLFGIFLCLGVFGVVSAQDDFYFAPCAFALPAGEIEGETILCGYIYMPENRADANNDNEIEIAFAALRSSAAQPEPEPLLYLEGGPGGSAVSYVQDWVNSAYRQRYDIILIDQRGTGFSFPSLNCFEYLEMDDGATQACRDRLADEEGIDLAAYNNAQNAADVADVIRKLGYEKANIYGVSYGTRLGLTVLRDHPQVVRTLMVDAVYPPSINGYGAEGFYFAEVLTTLFNDCAANSACNSAYPQLGERFYGTVDALNAQPVFVYDDEAGEELEFTGDALAGMIFDLMYDTKALPYLPAIIYEAREGDFTSYDAYNEMLEASATDPSTGGDTLPANLQTAAARLDAIANEYDYTDGIELIEAFIFDEEMDDAFMDDLSEDQMRAVWALFSYYTFDENDDSEGMFATVECRDEVPFSTEAMVDSYIDRTPDALQGYFADSYASMVADCAIWDLPAPNSNENSPVTSNIPTLVFSGAYDPTTPPSWGQIAADNTNGYHFVFPDKGHGVLFDACAAQITMAFLANPTTQPDGACLPQSAPDFVIN